MASARTTQLWEEGKARAQEGRWEEAWAAFSQASALNPTLNIRYNLAMSAFHTKRYVQAARLMSEIVATCDATCPEKIRSTTPERLREAEQYVGRISVQTKGGARILVDGETVDQNLAGRGWHVPPGRHEIVVHAGEHSVTRIVDVAIGQQEVVAVDFDVPTEPNSATPPPAEPLSPAPASTAAPYHKPILITGVTLTAVSLGVATAFTLKARAADQEAERLRSEISDATESVCSGSAVTTCNELAAANEDREDAATVAKVSWILSGALGVGTLATYFLWPKPASTAALSIVPLGGKQLGGLVVQGGF